MCLCMYVSGCVACTYVRMWRHMHACVYVQCICVHDPRYKLCIVLVFVFGSYSV